MNPLLKILFQKYAKRQLTMKVRPSLTEKGITTIPENKRVKQWADKLYTNNSEKKSR